MTAAAELAVVNRKTVYDWRHADPEFAAAWDDAIEAGTDLLEDEARRRAYSGYDKPLVSQGKVVGTYLEYSDTLMTLLLKGRRPKKFRENLKHELSGPDDGPMRFQATDLSDDDLARIAALGLSRRGGGRATDPADGS